MIGRLAIAILFAFLGLAAELSDAQSPPATTPEDRPASLREEPMRQSGAAEGPSDAEIRALAQKLVANQHRNDDALDQYERVERYVNRTSASNYRTIDDKSYRIVPTGSGTLKILLRDDGKPVDPSQYRRQLQLWESLLETMSRPNDSRAKTSLGKYAKRKRERAEFVDAAGSAFLAKWEGRETRNGRPCDVFELSPSPNFHPRSMFQDALAHVTAKLWVDRETTQIVRGEAHVTTDISFGGGILGKLYRGGVVAMEQAEVTPGIWLPTRYEYDFSGRKFLFPFEQHQTIDAGRYRRVGPPSEALATVREELASGKMFQGDP